MSCDGMSEIPDRRREDRPGSADRKSRRRGLAALLALGAFAAVWAGWYELGPRRTPHGQPPLTRLTGGNLADLREAFNTAGDRPRLLLLLSPT